MIRIITPFKLANRLELLVSTFLDPLQMNQQSTSRPRIRVISERSSVWNTQVNHCRTHSGTRNARGDRCFNNWHTRPFSFLSKFHSSSPNSGKWWWSFDSPCKEFQGHACSSIDWHCFSFAKSTLFFNLDFFLQSFSYALLQSLAKNFWVNELQEHYCPKIGVAATSRTVRPGNLVICFEAQNLRRISLSFDWICDFLAWRLENSILDVELHYWSCQ